MNQDGLKLLRLPFPADQISKLPKPKSKDAPKGKCQECGGWHGLPAVHLDYVGHAALTSRLLDADPSWSWEPVAFDAHGLPLLDANQGLWIKLTVCGVTRLGYGDAQGKTGPDAMKERIGDALRNAAMRFGAALDLWHKGDAALYREDDEKDEKREEGIASLVARFAADWEVVFRDCADPVELQAHWEKCKASCMKLGDGTQAMLAVKPIYAKRYKEIAPPKDPLKVAA